MVFDLRPGEWLDLQGDAKVQFIHKSGQAARLLVAAPRAVAIKKHKPQPHQHGDKHELIKP